MIKNGERGEWVGGTVLDAIEEVFRPLMCRVFLTFDIKYFIVTSEEN